MSKHQSISPPKFPTKFLRWFCNADLLEDVEGDLSELFAERAEKNRKTASLKYLRDVLFLFRPGIIKNIELKNGLINTAMIKNYLKIAFRNAKRYKGFTTLNLLGLVVGLVSAMLILLWVNDEIQVDKFHTNGDKVYQVFRNMKQSGGMVNTTWTVPKPVADLMRAEYPEVDEVVQISWPIEMRFQKGEDASNEQGYFATPNFLTLFSFEWLAGDKETALDDLSGIVISRTIAEKYFGSQWKNVAIGSPLEIDSEREAIVTGVIENVGENSSLQFDWLLPAEYYFNQNEWVDDWGNGSFRIYFTTHNEGEEKAVAERLYDEIITHAAGQDNSGEEYLIIHKFQDYYLYSNFENGAVSGGRIEYVRIMTVVAIFVLLIASINFMNLATARSGRRSKEIGLRKVMGAYKSSISFQFLIESILLCFLAMMISVLIVVLLMPYFNQLVDKQLFIDFSLPVTWYFLIGIPVIVGFFSGIYPALLLPTFGIINSLKGKIRQSNGAAYFRKGLVVFQFTISTLLIIGTGVIYLQLDYVLNKDLGIAKENLVAISIGERFGERLETYRTELQNIPEVVAVTASSGNPISYGRSTSSARWEGMSEEGYEINVLLTDDRFIETMGMEMRAGRAFDDQLSDSTNFIINEVMAELMGFEDPLNKGLTFWGIEGRVVGVVKNFHMRNLHEPIAPLIISCIDPAGTGLALVRIQGDPNNALKSMENVLSTLNPQSDFDYEFVDQAYAESYQAEMTVGTLARIFAGISIFISCLGLFGLSAFTAEQRSKEIGVRKVHGASINQLILLLSKDYTVLMVIAFILSIPFAYYYSQQWLEGFEYRTNLKPILFIVAGILTFVIGAVTVSVKSYQAAKANPVGTLRDE
ncbi:ABC transporter permease [Ekhidna sp.]|jgi:putative ABC transport system permease protein|uniref:ABC transporter permease n=1 Tax=Ekhidna sp. TaxID=2608089 RepID=UPI0032EFF6DB